MIQQVSGLLTPEWYELNYHPEQLRFWQYNGLLQVLRAGRQSGKTVLCCRKLVRHLPMETWHGKPGRYAYVGPTREQAKRIAWDLLKGLVNPMWLAEDPLETELKIVTIWGSELLIFGFDRPKRMEGIAFDGVVVDESSDIKPRAVEETIVPALSERNGWLVRTGVPKRAGVGALEYKRICEDKSLGYEFFHWSTEDFRTEEQLQHLRAQLSKKEYEEQIQGKAVDVGNLAFHAFSKVGDDSGIGNVLSGPETEYDKNRPIIVGTDFNVEPMAWCLAHIHNSSVYVFDEVWLLNTNTRATLNELYKRYGDHKAGWVFTGDATSKARKTAATSASPSDYAIIRQDGRFKGNGKKGVVITYPKSNPAIKDRLASCNAMLCNANDERRVFINPSCTHLIDDLEFRPVDAAGKPDDATKEMGHISDAFSYLVHRFFPIHLANLERKDKKKQTDTVGLSVVS